jgi:hypothetical protein
MIQCFELLSYNILQYVIVQNTDIYNTMVFMYLNIEKAAGTSGLHL